MLDANHFVNRIHAPSSSLANSSNNLFSWKRLRSNIGTSETSAAHYERSMALLSTGADRHAHVRMR